MSDAEKKMPPPPTWIGPNRTGEKQFNMVGQIRRRNLTVKAVENITPNYRRFVFSGDDLESDFPYVHFACADHVKVFFPDPVTGVIALPTPGQRGMKAPDGEPQPLARDYTPRAFSPERGELVIDIVVHENGPAGLWGKHAKVGSELVIAGPRANQIYPENYSHYILAGDESALPALSRFTEELPEGATAHVIALVQDASEELPGLAKPGVTVQWVHRAEVGGDGFVAAVKAHPLPEGNDWFVFAAGEMHEMQEIRLYLRKDLGLPKERVEVDGYWKREQN